MMISAIQKYARIFVLIFIFVCLTLNYTFPLHRESSDINPSITFYYANHNKCEDLDNHHDIKQRFKKSGLSTIINNKTKHSPLGSEQNNIESMSNIDKNILKNMDLRQYEQLVIIKKYPYLDIKELEMKYRPSGKTARHSMPLSELNHENEPSICDQSVDLLNVEISNRGLSGFAIPTQSTKQNLNNQNNLKGDAMDIVRDKYKLENIKQKVLRYLDENPMNIS